MTETHFSIVEHQEAQFHDEWAKSTDASHIDVKALFEPATGPENAAILTWMGDLSGKRILELGCGLGEASVFFAQRGAIVTATDISSAMLNFTAKLADLHGVSVTTILASANDLSSIPDQEFDFVYAANVLHHVNIDGCLAQIAQKLKPSGTAFFWDPIKYNPIINVYRYLAAPLRTRDEHPLTVSDVKRIRQFFPTIEVKFFWYSALIIFFLYFFLKRLNPGKVRYWKRIHEDASEVGWWLTWLHKIDKICFAWIPGIQWLSWNIIIKARFYE